MNSEMMLKKMGYVQRDGNDIRIVITEPFQSALTALENFTHVMVFGWIEKGPFPEYREVLEVKPPYAEEYTCGVFATRSPFRPNPILMTTCKIQKVDHKTGTVKVADLDMFDGTPIIDLKAYFPVCDRVKDAMIPEWLEGWPEWMPETGIGLEPHEVES